MQSSSPPPKHVRRVDGWWLVGPDRGLVVFTRERVLEHAGNLSVISCGVTLVVSMTSSDDDVTDVTQSLATLNVDEEEG